MVNNSFKTVLALLLNSFQFINFLRRTVFHRLSKAKSQFLASFLYAYFEPFFHHPCLVLQMSLWLSRSNSNCLSEIAQNWYYSYTVRGSKRRSQGTNAWHFNSLNKFNGIARRDVAISSFWCDKVRAFVNTAPKVNLTVASWLALDNVALIWSRVLSPCIRSVVNWPRGLLIHDYMSNLIALSSVIRRKQ